MTFYYTFCVNQKGHRIDEKTFKEVVDKVKKDRKEVSTELFEDVKLELSLSGYRIIKIQEWIFEYHVFKCLQNISKL
jgi:hypothetical protein